MEERKGDTGADDMAEQLQSAFPRKNKVERDAMSDKNFTSNDLQDQVKDFDDLPSLQSRDLMSQVEGTEHMSEAFLTGRAASQVQEGYSGTPRGRVEESSAKKVHKETPIIDKKNMDYISHKSAMSRHSSQVSLGSEQASNMGDMEDQVGFVLCLDHEQAIGITILACQFLYFNYAASKVRKRKL